MESHTEIAHFSISGDFITQHARDRVLEGNWENSIRFLRTSLIGFGYDDAIGILSGAKQLTGVNEVLMEEKVDTKYMRKLDEMYGHFICISRQWYTPYCYVTSYGPPDIGEMGELEQGVSTTGREIIGSHRARHYSRNPRSDKFFYLKCPDGENHVVIFEKAKEPPIWMKVEKSPQHAVNAASWRLRENGFFIEYPDYDFSRYHKNYGDVVDEKPKEKPVIEIPTIDSKLNSEFGWITPEGDFYGCEYAGHVSLSERLVQTVLGKPEFESNGRLIENNGEYELEKRGWMKLTGLGSDHYFFFGEGKRPTQAQHDFAWDWCRKHKKPFSKYTFHEFYEKDDDSEEEKSSRKAK